MTLATTTFLDAALSCIKRGWFVFPCWPGQKTPRIHGGNLSASNDEAQTRSWWAKWPDCNVGVSTKPSGLTIVDCDHGNQSEADFQAWRAGAGLSETYTVRTGRRDGFGVQMYYSTPGEDPATSMAWDEGAHSGDIRGSWGYVMAAGCLHPSGETYSVLVDAPIAQTPEWVRTVKKAIPKGKDGKPNPAWMDDGSPIEDHRNCHMISLLGKRRNAGADDDALHEYAVEVNDARFQPPLDESELDGLIRQACKWPVGEPDPVVIIGGKIAEPEAAKLPERTRPEYPISAWEGTVVAEFAKLCANDNNVPRKMYAEAFRCVLGAVVGDRISCPTVEGALPRTYTIVVAPKGKGKGTAIRHAVKFFDQSWDGPLVSVSPTVKVSATSGLLSGDRDFLWKPRGIGAWVAAASSVPGMARLTKDSDSTIKNKPHLTWGGTLPRILSVHEEMKTFLSTLFIEGGVGSGMEGVVCQLWDDVSFHGTATGTRDAVYGEMMFSMLCGVTEEDWFDLLSRGNAVGGGLMSRFNLCGTEGHFENVSRMKPPDFTALQETFLPRVLQLEDAQVRVLPTEAADKIISEWANNLPEGSERMNVHAWRSALLLAWLRHEESITAKTAEDAVRLGDYQVASHEYYRTKSSDNANARVQAKILRALEMKGPLSKRELQKLTNAHRDGTELWSRALDGLLRDKSVGKREVGAYYLAE
jgi:hypothetical protein